MMPLDFAVVGGGSPPASTYAEVVSRLDAGADGDEVRLVSALGHVGTWRRFASGDHRAIGPVDLTAGTDEALPITSAAAGTGAVLVHSGSASWSSGLALTGNLAQVTLPALGEKAAARGHLVRAVAACGLTTAVNAQRVTAGVASTALDLVYAPAVARISGLWYRQVVFGSALGSLSIGGATNSNTQLSAPSVETTIDNLAAPVTTDGVRSGVVWSAINDDTFEAAAEDAGAAVGTNRVTDRAGVVYLDARDVTGDLGAVFREITWDGGRP